MNIQIAVKQIKQIENNAVIISGQLVLGKIEPNIALSQIKAVNKELQKINNFIYSERENMGETNFKETIKAINRDSEYLNKATQYATSMITKEREL